MNPRIFWATKKVTIVGTPEEEKLWAERQAIVDEACKGLVVYESVITDDASSANN